LAGGGHHTVEQNVREAERHPVREIIRLGTIATVLDELDLAFMAPDGFLRPGPLCAPWL
jgi:hypothetical protein